MENEHKELDRLVAFVIIVALIVGLPGQAMAGPPATRKVPIGFHKPPGIAQRKLIRRAEGRVTHTCHSIPAAAVSDNPTQSG